jgi:hypothetical protein
MIKKSAMEKKHSAGIAPKKKRILIRIVVTVVVLFAVFRLLLPVIIVKYTNKQLQSLEEYTGSLEKVGMRVIHGAYLAKNFTLKKINREGSDDDTIPFLHCPRIEMSLDWGALFKGKIEGKIILEEPWVNFVNRAEKDKDLKGDTADFRKLIRKLTPVTINRFEILNGQVHYIDYTSDPQVDLSLTQINMTAKNLTNVKKEDELLPAHVHMNALTHGGIFTMDLNLDPLNKVPTFEMKTELKTMNLVSINDFFKSYGNIEVKKGTFSVYAEFAGKEGKFGGYVKPFINDFEIKKWKEDRDFSQRIWEMLVGTAMKILENPNSDKVATKIPVNGSFNDTNVNAWRAINYVLRNAFVQALKPTIDNTISVNKLNDKTPKTFLEKVFGSGNDKDKKSDSKSDKKDG